MKKKLLTFATCLMLAVSVCLGVVGLSACKKKTTEPEKEVSPVVGTWQFTKSINNETGLTNHTWRELEGMMFVFEDGTAWLEGCDCTWTFENNIFTIVLMYDNKVVNTVNMEYKDNQLFFLDDYDGNPSTTYLEKYYPTELDKSLLIGTWKFVDSQATYTFNDDFTGSDGSETIEWAQIGNLIVINKNNVWKYENGKLYKYDGVVMEKI